MKGFLFIILGITIIQQGISQQTTQWNNKQCAVVLTYDDALDVHLDHVIPALDSLNLKGTFYLVGESPVLRERISEWRLAAKHNHELGNHTLTHPCGGSLRERTWITPEKNLNNFSVNRAVNEIRVTNTLLHAIDGKTERTFAYPCGDTKIGGINFYDELANDFAGARGVQPGLRHLNEVKLDNVNAYGMNERSGEDMIHLVKEAMELGTLLVFLFHGVGGGHDMNVSLEAHRQLIYFLKEHENDIWNATMVDVAKFIRTN